ncbi:MAG: cation:proton antiporter, partial [Planctomycetota bacterium]
MGSIEVFWSLLLQIVVLLTGALVLGAVMGRLKQSPIVGYLLAGVLLGPNALNWVPADDDVTVIAELGVALLLFTIGLEFSLAKLLKLGWRVFVAGALQVVATSALFAIGLVMLGLSPAVATVLGLAMSLSSTEVVLAVMQSRGEVDSQHGRFALGILLMQDLAVIPIVLIVSAIAGSAGGGGEGAAHAFNQAAWSLWHWLTHTAHAAGAVEVDAPTGMGGMLLEMGKSFLFVGLFALAFFLFSRYVLPLLIRATPMGRDSQMTILLAIVLAAGAAYVAHQVEISPALGAFIAAIFLGESVIAGKLEADIGPVKTVFATLFFSSIGMLADPVWIVTHPLIVVGGVAAVVVGKAVVVWPIGKLLGLTHRHAIAAGVTIAQLGVFSFVVVGIARQGSAGLLSDDTFNAIVAITILTLFITPYLCRLALPTGLWVNGLLRRVGLDKTKLQKGEAPESAPVTGHVILVGFGPAGRAVFETLKAAAVPTVVLDLNPTGVLQARAEGAAAYVGDATRAELLTHANVYSAKAVIITLPDHRAVRNTIEGVRSLCSTVTIVARCRYDRYAEELRRAGAHIVINEERSVGTMLSVEVMQ